MSWGEHAGTLSAEQQLSHQAHAPAEGRMATLLPRSNRSSKVPQAVVSRSVPPYPQADQAAAKDRLVHGPTGRQQVATLPSSSAVEPPFEALSAAMLSAHLATHDYQSTTCTEC